MFRGWLRAYEWTLDLVLRAKFLMLLVTFGTLVATAYLYVIIPKGFFPTEDTGFISASTEASADISLANLAELQSQVSALIRKDPAVDYINSQIGPGGPSPTTNTGRMFIALKPRHERDVSSTQVIRSEERRVGKECRAQGQTYA